VATKAILLATDGSPSAHRALETAIELATTTGSSLHIVTAWSIPVSGFGYGAIPVGDLAEVERSAARLALEHAAAASTAAGVETTPVLRRGFPVEEICAAADECAAWLIVIGAHGWGRLKRLFLGSVSSAVLQHARQPVLVVRDVRAETPPAIAEAMNVGRS
jgi:nucleotide-binding universal stress UspA family protein